MEFRVLFAFNAEGEGELSISRDEDLYQLPSDVNEVAPEGWVFVRRRNPQGASVESGYVPRDYVAECPIGEPAGSSATGSQSPLAMESRSSSPVHTIHRASLFTSDLVSEPIHPTPSHSYQSPSKAVLSPFSSAAKDTASPTHSPFVKLQPTNSLSPSLARLSSTANGDNEQLRHAEDFLDSVLGHHREVVENVSPLVDDISRKLASAMLFAESNVSKLEDVRLLIEAEKTKVTPV